MESNRIFESLVESTRVGSFVLILVGVILWSWSRGSAAAKHQLLCLSLLGFLVVPLVVTAAHNGEDTVSGFGGEGCFSHHTYAAAGKFTDLDMRTDPVDSERAANSVLAPHGWLLGAWFGVSLLLLMRLGHRLLAVHRLCREATPVHDPGWPQRLAQVSSEVGLGSPVRLLTHPAVRVPMIWGPPGSSLIIPASLLSCSRETARLFLLHELAHVKRRDSLWKLGADLVCCLLWFNPLVWVARNALERQQERAADSHVIHSGVKPSVYGASLLRLFRRHNDAAQLRYPSVSYLVGTSPLTQRLRAIVDPEQDHRTPGRRGSLIRGMGFLLGLLLFSLLGRTPLLGLGPHAGQSETGETSRDDRPLPELLNRVFVNKMADYYVAGAAVTVVLGGETIYRGGFGRADVFRHVPVEPGRTIFRIGSVTKVFTGIAVLQLVDRGLLDLEDDVNEHLDAFQIDSSFAEPVRIKHLLTHTAGFDQLGYGRHARTASEKLPLEEFLEGNLVRIRPPGEVSCYDTYAITLAGYLIEATSGLPYEEYLEKNILHPLEMHRTSITVPESLAQDVAVGYEFRGEWHPQEWEYMNTDPASTLNSTAVDMANVVRMLLAGGVFKGKRVLSEKSVRSMLTRQFTNHPLQPGYGYTMWEDPNYGIPAFSHGGSMTGYGCFLYVAPAYDLGVFVCYNQESGRLGRKVIETVVEKLVPDRPPPPAPRPAFRGHVDVKRFLGTYASNVYNHTRPERGGWRARPFDLTADEAGALQFEGRPCHPVEELVFQRDDGLLLAFRENAEGEITHLFVRQSVYEKLR